MPEITLPVELLPNTVARASDVMANFNVIVAAINGGLEAVNLHDLSVSTGKLQDEAVTTEKLDDEAVTTPKLADLSVTTAKLEDAAVTEAKLANASVTTAKLAGAAVVPSKTSFLQDLPVDAVIYYARVAGTDGAFIDSANLPAGASSTKLSTGLYRVTTGYGGASHCVFVTPLSTTDVPPALFASVREFTSGEVTVAIYNASGVLTDSTFAFMFAGRD